MVGSPFLSLIGSMYTHASTSAIVTASLIFAKFATLVSKARL